MGKSSGGSSGASQMAEYINLMNYKKAKPLQESVYGGLRDFMNGGRDVSQNPVWQAGKYGAESSYQTGMDNLLSNTPAGGALYEGMGNLENERAGTLTNIMAQIAQDEYNKAYGIASGDPQTSVSSLAQIGQAEDARNAADAQSANQATGQAASAVASIATMIAMLA